LKGLEAVVCRGRKRRGAAEAERASEGTSGQGRRVFERPLHPPKMPWILRASDCTVDPRSAVASMGQASVGFPRHTAGGFHVGEALAGFWNVGEDCASRGGKVGVV
jgi:hypothetical protein